jgi:hypothetical protein
MAKHASRNGPEEIVPNWGTIQAMSPLADALFGRTRGLAPLSIALQPNSLCER